jgi:hypothetical protein
METVRCSHFSSCDCTKLLPNNEQDGIGKKPLVTTGLQFDATYWRLPAVTQVSSSGQPSYQKLNPEPPKFKVKLRVWEANLQNKISKRCPRTPRIRVSRLSASLYGVSTNTQLLNNAAISHSLKRSDVT